MGLLDIFSSVKKYAVTQQDLIDAAKNTDTLIIDVRSFLEYKQSHLTPCHNVDVRDKSFEEKISKYDKAKPYILVCQSGPRSKKALKTMLNLGFEHLVYLEGGIAQWTGQKRLK